ncbi:MAG TPA: S8 family peptidase [Ohtaekwangia sp.]|nr:S8 family peptidase [Ohtaekwangia sp.]
MAWNSAKLILLFVIGSHGLFAQVNRYMVFFKDKAGTIYNTSDPTAFLSPKAIARREKQGIPVFESDIPVNEHYVQGVQSAGADAFFRTRWMNGVLVQCAPDVIPALEALPYVSAVEFVAPHEKLLASGRAGSPLKLKSTKAGAATEAQLGMIGLDDMHREGYKGENMTIAIFDGGFEGVNLVPPFQHIFTEGRLDLDLSHDYVFNSDDVFQYDDHGTFVFSVIAAYQEGTFTGGAYEANYQLYVTEDAGTEYRIEEYNWLFAAERADSAGVDIVSSSLGYYDFDDNSMNYSKSAMDGKTTVVTRAAQALADRGVVVVCSAGNEGNIDWQIITAPADAFDVLAVASVNAEGVRANSSSRGPSADGRIKPDVAAMGQSTSVIRPNGSLGNVSGTSLAAPLITSLVAGVWQKYPNLTNKEVIALIKNSASRAKSPDNLTGYGIPDFESVTAYLTYLEQNPFEVFPNAVVDTILIRPFSPGFVSSCQVELVSAQGQRLMSSSINFSREHPDFTADLSAYAAGIYFLRVQWNGNVTTHRLVKQ